MKNIGDAEDNFLKKITHGICVGIKAIMANKNHSRIVRQGALSIITIAFTFRNHHPEDSQFYQLR